MYVLTQIHPLEEIHMYNNYILHFYNLNYLSTYMFIYIKTMKIKHFNIKYISETYVTIFSILLTCF